MNKNDVNPYIRIAMYSTILAPFTINDRIIFDYEIILVSGGKCKITIDKTEYTVKEKDIVLLRPDIPHKFESIDNIDFVQPHIHFDMAYSENSEITPVSFKPKKAMSNDELKLITKDILKDYNIPYVFRPADEKLFRNVFFEIIDLYTEKKNNYELLCKSKMLELIHIILSQFETSKANSPVIETDTIVAVKDYIDNNFLSNISLDYLATQFCINKFTLIRKFKDIYKQNIMSYYREKRMEYAKKILTSSKRPIGAIAEKMSFSDIYSFSRFFKNNEGVSPMEYRKTTY